MKSKLVSIRAAVAVTLIVAFAAVFGPATPSLAVGGVPSISSVNPTAGLTSGGDVVTITGMNFLGATAVNFGAVPASNFTVDSDTQIRATSPPHAADIVDISVTSLLGTSSNSPNDQFTYVAPQPQVTGVAPSEGPQAGGVQVVISGHGFTAATEVDFGVTPVKPPNIVVNSDSQITVPSIPAAANPGQVDITVKTAGGTSSTSAADKFTYVGAPTVDSVTPNQGSTAGGQVVTVSGTNFHNASAVTFGTTAATSFTVNSDTSITATAPAEGAATVHVHVTAVGGTSSTNTPNDEFTYVAVPVVTGVSPTGGFVTGGNAVTITGSGFSGATAVMFGTHSATPFMVNPAGTQITTTAPAATSTGTVHVHVTTVGGTNGDTGANNDSYTYVATGSPQVTSVAPNIGPAAGGTSVKVGGVGFTNASAVHFGTVAASTFHVDSDNQITVTSPVQPAATVDVTVTTPVGTSSANSNDQFTYVAAPTVTSVSPSGGPAVGGTSVTITGTAFGSPNVNTPEVRFGPNPATNIVVVSPTSITATSPAGAGVVDVVVKTQYGGSSATSSADHFTYGPTVDGVSPTQGPTAGGTSVTVTGSGFATGGTPTVKFGTNSGTGVSVIDDAHLTATSPAGSGSVDVRVTTGGGTSPVNSPADVFQYDPMPTVSGVSPNFGSTQGGDSVTITGTNFDFTSEVDFGPGNAAPSFAFVDSSHLTATTPSGFAGSVDVQVITPGGTSATNANDTYDYVQVPTVASVSPTAGPVAGGTTVTITGTGFSQTPPLTVTFGTTPATTVTPIDDSHLTAVAPPEAAGTVDVTVTDKGGTSPTSPADQFTYFATPAVTAVNPNVGPPAGGTSVTITGTAFTGATSVMFGSTAASTFTVNSDTQITATSPAEARGFVDVTVTNPGGTSAINQPGDQFQYAITPTVTSVNPSSGPRTGGTTVTVTGTGFTDSVPTVKFGTNAATGVTVQDDSHLSAVSPAGTAGTVDVVVTTTGGTSATSAADKFTYTALGVSASSTFPIGIIGGYGPENVTIFGSGFQPGATVTSNNAGVSIVVNSVSPNQISTTMNTRSASASAASVGLSSLTVHNPDGGTANVNFLVAASGYYTVTQAGTVSAFGSVPFLGDLTGQHLNKPIVGMAATPTGNGYWLVASDGGIFAFGDAVFYGSEGGAPLNKPIVGMAATPSGHGYWLVASDGGIFTHGDAGFFGSEGGAPLNKPVVGMARTRDGNGYWLVASDGGIFTHGDAGFFGSEGGEPLNKPVVGMEPTGSGNGYWLVASDGGVFTHGDAPFVGSLGSDHLNSPIVGMAPGLTGQGYYLLGGDGGVFTFNVPFYGSSPTGGAGAAIADVARIR